MCFKQDVINRKKVPKLKLNSIWNNIHNLLPPKVDLKLSLGGPLAIGVLSWKHNVFTWLSAPCNMRSFSLVRLWCLRNHQNINKLIEKRVLSICGLKWNLIFERISSPNDADNFKEGYSISSHFQFRNTNLLLCAINSVNSVSTQRLYGDYISTEHINHRALALLVTVFCEIWLLMVFKTLWSRDLSDSVTWQD